MKKNLIFDKYYVNKYRFHMCKEQISINKVNINRIYCLVKYLRANWEIMNTMLDIIMMKVLDHYS